MFSFRKFLCENTLAADQNHVQHETTSTHLCAMKKDIQTRADITFWMTRFYDQLVQDEVTAGFFTHINLEQHLPHIVDFWCFVLLDEAGYTTNVFNKHAGLRLEEIHFRHWVQHFVQTTDLLFEGEKAQLAKQRAKLLASTFYHKMSGIYLLF